jgi:hypothetical protein
VETTWIKWNDTIGSFTVEYSIKPMSSQFRHFQVKFTQQVVQHEVTLEKMEVSQQKLVAHFPVD